MLADGNWVYIHQTMGVYAGKRELEVETKFINGFQFQENVCEVMRTAMGYLFKKIMFICDKCSNPEWD